MLGDVCASSLLPRTVSALLQRTGAGSAQLSAGFSPGGSEFSWVLALGQLHIWRHREGVDARLISIHLPAQLQSDGAGDAGLFVQVVSYAAASGAATAVACTPSGLLVAWPNAEFATEPVVAEVPGTAAAAGSHHVTAFTAIAPPAASGMLFLAALTLSDGSLHVVQGSQQGMHSRQLAPGAAAAAATAAHTTEPRGMLGALGHALANAYTGAFHPNAKLVKRTPAGRPAVALLARSIDVHRVHVWVATDTAVDCWLVRNPTLLLEMALDHQCAKYTCCTSLPCSSHLVPHLLRPATPQMLHSPPRQYVFAARVSCCYLLHLFRRCQSVCVRRSICCGRRRRRWRLRAC